MKKIQVLVCAHKEDSSTRNDDIYTAVQGGKALHPEIDLGFLKDNTGDNISEKNPYWSELTVLYWGWKNVHNVEYIGLNHYRRYFDIEINAENIDNLMHDYDMMVVKSNSMMSNHERPTNLMHLTSIEDYYVFADTFLYMYPEYKKEFIEYFYHSRKSFPFQMFIAKKEIYDDYCSFMFPVLFEVEKRVKPHGYTRQKRAVGYFGEWFLGLYIYCKHLNVKPVPLLDFSFTEKKYSIKHILIDKTKRLFFRFNDIIYQKPKNVPIPLSIKAGLRGDGIEITAF